MAHIAILDENHVVIDVYVVNNSDILDGNGAEDEDILIDFAIKLWGARFGADRARYRQTSYGRKFRKNYAGIGYSFDPVRDAFIPPQPYPSWSLNETTCLWQSPIPYPEDGNYYVWNETAISWQKTSET